jgi:hypothetical protein
VEGNATKKSPAITGHELEGKTRSQIRELAIKKGLIPAGNKSSHDFPRKWIDPITNQERLRLDRGHTDPLTGKPYENPNAAEDHVHGYGPDGKTRITVDGDPHIPTAGE